MLFGEIIEPSTRAFCDDDPQYLENYRCDLVWDVDQVPETIDNLFVAESTRITTLFHKCLLQNANKYAELTPGYVRIYQAKNDYIVLICNVSDIIPGLVVEALSRWLKSANSVYVITSGLLTSLQNSRASSPCVIRSLCYKTTSTYPKLEVPNMVTGLSASVLSYCIHIDRSCSLYIGFFDEASLDSLNTYALLNLLETFGLRLHKRYEFENSNQSNNLYI
ncbi:hypothetical protein FQR65_LT00263 [Abscondita terminalis]|nr:hypothetical protein FQR65_LT00263 [Abscondita terminalis]